MDAIQCNFEDIEMKYRDNLLLKRESFIGNIDNN